jgi:hypothetical protein
MGRWCAARPRARRSSDVFRSGAADRVSSLEMALATGQISSAPVQPTWNSTAFLASSSLTPSTTQCGGSPTASVNSACAPIPISCLPATARMGSKRAQSQPTHRGQLWPPPASDSARSDEGLTWEPGENSSTVPRERASNGLAFAQLATLPGTVAFARHSLADKELVVSTHNTKDKYS